MMLTGGRSTSQPSRTRQKRPARPRVRAASADTPSEP
jgi:hypothetical protein